MAPLSLTEALQVRYTVERELGRGGMATVYLARDLKHDRPVALKVLLPEVAASVGPARFQREIETAARLQHPHIVGVYDSGEASGFLYYTMPYVPGGSLRTRLAREGELPVADAVRILRDVLEALSYAHQHGVVHRDIKPDNVMLSARAALVTDFGIAKALSDVVGPQLTTAGIAVGTPSYMAPEQAMADSHVDHRADIYAVGVLAYELLAGEPPFTGPGQQVLAAHVTKAAPPVGTKRARVPPELAHAVMRCLEKRPADRWQTAEDLLARLEAVSTDSAWGVTAELSAEPVEQTFRLTEAVCRRVARAVLDARIIGDDLHYLDNQVESDVLVYYLHGTGLDQRDFTTILRDSPYRGIAPTLYGCEPVARRRLGLPLAAHATLIAELLREVINRTHPSVTVIVGFSSGGDLAFQLLRPSLNDLAAHVDGLITLDCNLSLDTCFVTRVLAGMSDDSPSFLADLQSLGGRARSLGEWVNTHDYLVKILRKFHGHVGPLRSFAKDIVAPFEEAGPSPFGGWFREVSAVVGIVQCIFSDTDANNLVIDRLRLENLDVGLLGLHYGADSIVIEPDTEHFELLDSRTIHQRVDEIVTLRRGIRAHITPKGQGG